MTEAFRLWCWYFVATADYNRTVCTGPIIDDLVEPANDEERERVARNAALTGGIVQAAITRLQITSEDSMRGRAEAWAIRSNMDDLRRHALAPYTSSLPPRPR